MCQPANNPHHAPECAESLIRAEALDREISDLCAQINAANYRLLQLIVALDNEKPWGAWGLTSCAHWLNWRCGIGLNAAREKVRVAHALVRLPDISKAFACGELSFSKVRALTRIADSGNESELLHLARQATAAQVEKLVRAYRRVERLQENERATAQRASRGLTYINPATKYVVFRASDKRQIKAQLAGNGCSIDKSCNAEMALIRSPYHLIFNKLGQRVFARRLRYRNLL